MRKVLPVLAMLLMALLPAGASADGLGILGAARYVDDGPYRYVALAPHTRRPLSVIERIDTRDSTVERWWYLRGTYYLPAVAADGSPGGPSANGLLVLSTLPQGYPPKRTEFAILDTRLHLSHPHRDPGSPHHAVTRVSLPGAWSFDAVSPDGSRIYLIHNFLGRRYPGAARYEVRALDTATGQLLPEPIVDPEEPDEEMQGSPVTRVSSPDGRWAYTLYTGSEERFVHALDTVRGHAVCIDLPQLEGLREPFQLRMRLGDGGRELRVYSRDTKDAGAATLLAIDTETFEVRSLSLRLPVIGRLMEPLLAALALLAAGPQPAPVAERPPSEAGGFLAFAETPRRPGNLLSRYEVVGRSAAGRPIEMWQYGDPAWSGELLVFGCIHGDECGARGIKPTAPSGGCPDPSADIHLVPNLNPDGAAAGSRLNGRGVDLNRNFPSEWRPFGHRGDPEYSGPKPSSEPETRLAERIVRDLRPEATIWFHQFRGQRPFVRAWGQSETAGRRFAHLARMPFRAMRWPAGTAPNWQNHRFPSASSFVVELPRGRLEPEMRDRLAKAIVRLGRWVRED
jgi:hypothetical protein